MDQIVYGIHPVEEALRSTHLQFQKILIGADKIHSHLQSVLDLAARRRVPIVHSTGQALDQMTKGALHQNIVGIINGIAYKSVEEILSRWKKEGTKALLIILDGIQDPQNLGSLIRTASGCGAHGMIIPRDRAAGITPAVIKASAGAAAYFPVARVVNLSTVIEKLKKEGLWVYGAAGEAEAPVYHTDFNVDLAIVIGAEEKGIRPLVRKKCDQLFSIPMRGPLPSFNASVAAGMILYEVMRQRSR